MKKANFIKSFVLSATFSLVMINTGFAQWKNLFNGKDLKGWNQKNGKARYTVENGEIVGTTVANTTNSFLCTELKFETAQLLFLFYRQAVFG